MLKTIIVLLALSSHYEDSLQATDSCRTLAYNSLYNKICFDNRNILERAEEQAKKTNMSLDEYIYYAILERIEYDEEQEFFE